MTVWASLGFSVKLIFQILFFVQLCSEDKYMDIKICYHFTFWMKLLIIWTKCIDASVLDRHCKCPDACLSMHYQMCSSSHWWQRGMDVWRWHVVTVCWKCVSLSFVSLNGFELFIWIVHRSLELYFSRSRSQIKAASVPEMCEYVFSLSQCWEFVLCCCC